MRRSTDHSVPEEQQLVQLSPVGNLSFYKFLIQFFVEMETFQDEFES